MRKMMLAVMMAALACSCTTTLYNWGGGPLSETSSYEERTYAYFNKQTPESLCALVCMYEDIVSSPGGTRQVPPPGVCAEYGYLLLMQGTAETFASHASSMQKRRFKSADYASIFAERGRQMLQRELELYPESQRFIAPLLKKL